MKEKCEFERLIAAQEDDAARLEQDQDQPQTVAARIDAYLTGRLNSREMDALYQKHGQAIERERLRREEAADQKKVEEKQRMAALWENRRKPTPEENVADQAVIEQFCRNHKSFRRDISANGERLLGELRANGEPISTENLEKAYAFLLPQNVFVHETEEERRVQNMGSEQYRKEHAEDWPEEGIPFLVLQRMGKILDTFTEANPRYIRSDSNKNKIVSALVKSGMQITTQSLQEIYNDLASRGELDLGDAVKEGEVLRYSDMGGHAPGYPRESSKYSFREKVRSMTADEIRQRCLDDKNFKIALDNLK